MRFERGLQCQDAVKKGPVKIGNAIQYIIHLEINLAERITRFSPALFSSSKIGARHLGRVQGTVNLKQSKCTDVITRLLNQLSASWWRLRYLPAVCRYRMYLCIRTFTIATELRPEASSHLQLNIKRIDPHFLRHTIFVF